MADTTANSHATETSAIDAAQAEQPPDEYAIVEIFGHRRHAGRIAEVDRFGARLLRIDIPTDCKFDNVNTTHFYGGSSIFSLSPCDLATVEKLNKPYRSEGLLTHRDEDHGDDENPEFLDD